MGESWGPPDLFPAAASLRPCLSRAPSPDLLGHLLVSQFLRSGQFPQETRCQLRLAEIQEAGHWVPASSTLG